MAAGTFTDDVNVRCSESLFICQICMDPFVSPRILPCQHTFCKQCVMALIKRHCMDKHKHMVRDAYFPCPMCRKKCKIRTKSTETEVILKHFPENLLLKSLLEADKTNLDKQIDYFENENARKESETATLCNINENDKKHILLEQDMVCLIHWHLFRYYLVKRMLVFYFFTLLNAIHGRSAKLCQVISYRMAFSLLDMVPHMEGHIPTNLELTEIVHDLDYSHTFLEDKVNGFNPEITEIQGVLSQLIVTAAGDKSSAPVYRRDYVDIFLMVSILILTAILTIAIEKGLHYVT